MDMCKPTALMCTHMDDLWKYPSCFAIGTGSIVQIHSTCSITSAISHSTVFVIDRRRGSVGMMVRRDAKRLILVVQVSPPYIDKPELISWPC